MTKVIVAFRKFADAPLPWNSSGLDNVSIEMRPLTVPLSRPCLADYKVPMQLYTERDKIPVLRERPAKVEQSENEAETSPPSNTISRAARRNYTFIMWGRREGVRHPPPPRKVVPAKNLDTKSE
jgi:hypothetical protein